MTDLDVMKRAKDYIEKLANGIDPISGRAVPDEEVINNVRISRCLFYVSGVLGKVIDNGGVVVSVSQGRGKKLPFSITDDELKRFEYSDTGIGISEIVKRINACVANGDDMVKLSHKGIVSFLIDAGILEERVREDGRKVKYPTEAGKAIGINYEERTGSNGNYVAVLYNREAQKFVLDNLPIVLSQ